MTLADRFRRAFYGLMPPQYHSGEGELFLFSLGVILDAAAERVYQGLLARFPQRGHHSTLSFHGRDRQIIRGRNERPETYASRLIRWRYPKGHRVRGNPFALLDQIQAYFAPFGKVRVRTVDRRGNWYLRDRDGTESYSWNVGDWDWDAESATKWSRFWVIVYLNDEHGNPLWDLSGTWGDGSSWGEDHNPGAIDADYATLRQICRQWRPAGTKPEWLIFTDNDSLFVPSGGETDGNFGNWGRNVGATQTPTRHAGARYLSLRSQVF